MLHHRENFSAINFHREFFYVSADIRTALHTEYNYFLHFMGEESEGEWLGIHAPQPKPNSRVTLKPMLFYAA